MEGKKVIRDVTDALFIDLMKHAEKMIVVEFWSPSCSICREVAPAYEQVSQEMEAEAHFLRINTNANVQVAQRYGITGTPTFMLFCREGKLADIVGMTSATMLRNTIRDTIKYKPNCPGKRRINYEMDGYG
jgi:thioredoxin 1